MSIRERKSLEKSAVYLDVQQNRKTNVLLTWQLCLQRIRSRAAAFERLGSVQPCRVVLRLERSKKTSGRTAQRRASRCIIRCNRVVNRRLPRSCRQTRSSNGRCRRQGHQSVRCARHNVLCRVRGLSRNHLRIGVSRFNREPDASVGKDSGHGFDCSSRVIPSLENVSTQSPGD
jgi:hypothetical protein